MREEQYVRSAASSPAPDGSVAGSPGDGQVAVPGVAVPKVDSVPSDQLWRAAILAARQAALTAAELRRALEATQHEGREQ